jgi:glycosyltransferase involved in cell wall biosynthesis
VTLPQTQYSKQLEKKYGWNVSFFAAGFDPTELPQDLTKNEAREKLNIHHEEYVLLCSSRIVPEKQIDKLITVLGGLKEFKWKCYITGYGPDDYVSEIRKTIDLSSLSGRVYVVGHVSFEVLSYYYKASDLFFMTSIKEAGPGSANMAAWYGLPIISTKTGSVAELLDQDNAGYLVDPKNYDEWNKALIFAFTGNKIKLLDKNILLHVKGRKSNMERMANTIKNVYNSFYRIKPN